MHALKIANRLLYGTLVNPDFMRVTSCMFNYAIIYCTYQRAKHEQGIGRGLLVAGLLTVLGYHIIPSAAGVSSLWAFAFGYITLRSNTDHLIYWLASASIIIPWTMDEDVCKKYDRTKWPWEQSYLYIAVAAHLGFAVLGAALSAYNRKQ